MTASRVIQVFVAVTISFVARANPPLACPIDEAKSLHPSIGRAAALARLGVEAFTGGQFGPDRMLITVLSPVSLFECSNVLSNPSPTSRHLVAWRQVGDRWREVARNSEILYPLDTYGRGQVSMEFTSNGFRLKQEAAAARYERADVLTFEYDSRLPGLRISQWVTREFRNDNGAGPRGDDENRKILEERMKRNPKISAFDGYRGEIDFRNGRGWIEYSAWGELPMLKQLSSPSEPISLPNARWPFPK